MKVTTVLGTAALILLPGVIVPVGAQEHEGEKQPEQKQHEAKPAQRQQQAKPASHSSQAQHPQQGKPEQKQQRAANQRKTEPAQQHAARQHQAKPSPPPQPVQEQLGARRTAQPAADHSRIPDDRFRANFGRSHTFHVNRSEFANGSGRFQYGGFWFNAVEPWPVGWLYTDNVYVDYLNGGYFLCNPLHPGVYISVNIG